MQGRTYSSLFQNFSCNVKKYIKLAGVAAFIIVPLNTLADINSNDAYNGSQISTFTASVKDVSSQAYITKGAGAAISAVTGLVVTGVCCTSNASFCNNSTSSSFGMFSNPSVDVSSTKYIGQNYLYNLLGHGLVAAGLGSPTSVCTYLTTECGCGTANHYVKICATNSAAQYTGGVTTKGCMVVDSCVSCTDNNGSTGGTWDPGSVSITTTA